MFRNTEVAYKYKMSSMQAALGLAQLERVEELVERKRAIFAWYESRLAGVEGLSLNSEAPGVTNTYWMATVIVDPKFGLRKEQLMALLESQGIDSRPVFHPLSSLPAYVGLEQSRLAQPRNRVSYRISPYGINLPSGLNLTEQMVAYVCDTLKTILHNRGTAG